MSEKCISDPNSGIKYGYIYQGKTYEGLVCNALEFIWNNGGNVTDNGKVVINSPKSIEGLQQFIDIANSDIAEPGCMNYEEDESWEAFKSGSTLFMRNWPYAYKLLNDDDSPVKGKVGVAPLPLGPSGKKSACTLGGWNYMINANSKNPDTAWKFIKWMSSYETQVMDTSLGGYVPTRIAALEDSRVINVNPWITDFRTILESAKVRPASLNYNSASECMQVNFKDALLKRIDAKTAIQNIENSFISNRSIIY
jgi:multiple sugar transport system substrate-binding protein